MVNKRSMLGVAFALAVAVSGCVGPFAPHAAGGGKGPGAAATKGQKAAKPTKTPGAGTARAGGSKQTPRGAPAASGTASQATPTPQLGR
jgi:hypothetical protein